MAIIRDGCLETNSNFPNSNWYEDEADNVVIDETTEEGEALVQKIISLTPYYDLVFDEGGKVIDAVENPQKKADWLAQIEQHEKNRPPTEQERIEALESALLSLMFRGGGDV